MSSQTPGTNVTIPPEILSPPFEVSYGVHPYKAPAVMVFAIIGLILQIPVIYTHCGLFGAPNVPVTLMSLFYLYFMLSTTISAAHWSHGDVTQWWDGKGWCDLDSRLGMALSLGSLAAQCVININIVSMLRWRPQADKRRVILIRTIWQLAAVLFLPVVNLAVSTFTTYRRYQVTQDVGCAAVLDGSAALIVIFFMWIPFLGAVAFCTILFIAFKFWRQGTNKTMEKVSFVPNMTSYQFLRILLFAFVVTFVLVPLSVTVAAINFISIHSDGVQELAWAHGKPLGWNSIIKVNFAELKLVGTNITRATLIVNAITMYVNIAIAWLIFLCYGTGVLSMKAYRAFANFILTGNGRYDISIGSHREIRWLGKNKQSQDVLPYGHVLTMDTKDMFLTKSRSIANSDHSANGETLENTDLFIDTDAVTPVGRRTSRRLTEALSSGQQMMSRNGQHEWSSSLDSKQLYKQWESSVIKNDQSSEGSFFTTSPDSDITMSLAPSTSARRPILPVRDFLGMKSFRKPN